MGFTSPGRLSSLPTFQMVIAGCLSCCSWPRSESFSASQSNGAGSVRSTRNEVPAMTVMLYARHLSRKSVWSSAWPGCGLGLRLRLGLRLGLGLGPRLG